MQEAANFTTVFDVAASGYKDWQFPAFGLIFVTIGIAIFFAPMLIKRMGIPFLDFPSKRLILFRYGWLGFALIWTAIAFTATYGTYQRHRNLVDRNACAVVEGQVTDFVPMPYAGYANESFSVSGVRFSYSDYGVSDAFNKTSSHGGPIKRDSYVRICYDPSENAILKLQIRDFKGTKKDYSRGDNVFGEGGGGQSPGSSRHISSVRGTNWFWLADIWITGYFLDIVAFIVMFLPYFRTFWCLKTVPLHDVSLPEWLKRDHKTKLRNSLAYWETSRSTVWIRARGFNFFRVAGAVAKINLDSNSDSITSGEIRFSSGIPIIVVLFFVSAFLMFSERVPSGSQVLVAVPVVFLAFVAAVFLISASFQRRRLISRWEILLREAVEEFGNPDRSSTNAGGAIG